MICFKYYGMVTSSVQVIGLPVIFYCGLLGQLVYSEHRVLGFVKLVFRTVDQHSSV